MKRVILITVALVLVMCGCKTKYIETVHYQPVEVHDTINKITTLRDSITLHDSVFIHLKNDTVYHERWKTEYRWHTKFDTVYSSREVPYVVTDTIYKLKEVPVEKIVYKQKWWQKISSGAGIVFLLGLLASLYLNLKRR